ncbi:MAG TPA: hypothetical protein V6D28_08055 [Leptolyngbyaceae cyanobacterium]
MSNNVLISLLKTELAEREQEASRLRKVAEEAQAEAARLESLAGNIRATLQGIASQENQENSFNPNPLRQSPPKSYTNGTLANGSLNGSRASPEIYIENNNNENQRQGQAIDSKLETKQDKSRNPKDYQRREYRGRGYIQIAKRILEKHPEGLHIGQLVEIIFDYESSEEFTKAKRCLQAELLRGVKENRLGKEGDYYFCDPKIA